MLPALVVFWCAVVLVGYAYIGYPVILALVGSWRRSRRSEAPSRWPLITIALPVHNEEAAVGQALDAILEADYPAERRQIIVVSDASTDKTDALVREYGGRGVELLQMPVRRGKTAAENAACHAAHGELIVTTDASARVHPMALKRLVVSFGDPSVGVASGRDVSVARVSDWANSGEMGYVGYEMWVRGLETKIAGIVGASGCLFAMRSELSREPVPEALSRDFAAPLIAREHGFRSVSVSDAVCLVPRTPSLQDEHRRKIRTMTRGLQTLFYKRHLLNPLRHGMFAWTLFSHKLVRWLVPWAVLAAVGSCIVLASTQIWARWALAGGGLFAILSILPWLPLPNRRFPRFVALPAYLTSGLIAGLRAWIGAFSGPGHPVWEPTRRDAATPT